MNIFITNLEWENTNPFHPCISLKQYWDMNEEWLLTSHDNDIPLNKWFLIIFDRLAQGPQATLALWQALKNEIRQKPEARNFLSRKILHQEIPDNLTKNRILDMQIVPWKFSETSKCQKYSF